MDYYGNRESDKMVYRIYGFIGALLVLFFLISLVGCGQDKPRKTNITLKKGPKDEPKEIKFTDEKVRESCFSAACHNSNAPTLVGIQEGFKLVAKVRARVLAKTMPPGGWSDEKIAAFILYLDSE